MTTSAAPLDDTVEIAGSGFEVHSGQGPAPREEVVGFGFWVFLLSDIVIFATFFAAYAVLHNSTAGGADSRALFRLGNVALETLCLLLSSYACALAHIALGRRAARAFLAGLAATFVLGALFLTLELREFSELLERGATPQSSAFLSSFYALVGLHGAHISVGLLWLATIAAQFLVQGEQKRFASRFFCFALYWHALDLVWIGIFTVVYLMGTLP
jgi:cytochrome o ubiquinol oxidase subunit 3